MSYQVLARKWRPRTFREMVGQTHVLQTLIHALDNQRLHHAYLFTGTRGVGKTTIARILARCLNCETGVTSTPCGECSACREINEGRFIDLIEVDAASRTKVEDTRELLENVQYAPSRGRYKVYLIDEVHMLSNHSFNALLKTLEEPPPHVKFLLATTDPQKLPVTVLSRCLQFSLKNLSPERLVEHLKHILAEEKISFEDGALWLLGRAAQGSVRDCLTLLDQAIGFCNGGLTTAGVSEFLGSIDQAIIQNLMDALVAEDAAAVLAVVRAAADSSPDFAAVLQELLSWLHRVAIAQVVPEAIDNSLGDREQVLAHAAALSKENLQLYYQMALKGREDMAFALDARSGLEMTLLRMLAFTPQTASKSATPKASNDLASAGQKKKLSQQFEQSPQVVEAPVTPKQAIASVASESVTKEVVAKAPAAIATSAAPRSIVTPVIPFKPTLRATAAESDSAPEPIQTLAEPAISLADATSAALQGHNLTLTDLSADNWPLVFAQLGLTGVTRSIASHCAYVEASDAGIALLLDSHHGALFNEEHRRRIEQALSDYFSQALKVTIEQGKSATETPAARRLRLEDERKLTAVQEFTHDPVVQGLIERFGAVIDFDSITPLTPSQH
jgi:DNA polymerase III subunit gamma/tau